MIDSPFTLAADAHSRAVIALKAAFPPAGGAALPRADRMQGRLQGLKARLAEATAAKAEMIRRHDAEIAAVQNQIAALEKAVKAAASARTLTSQRKATKAEAPKPAAKGKRG